VLKSNFSVLVLCSLSAGCWWVLDLIKSAPAYSVALRFFACHHTAPVYIWIFISTRAHALEVWATWSLSFLPSWAFLLFITFSIFKCRAWTPSFSNILNFHWCGADFYFVKKSILSFGNFLFQYSFQSSQVVALPIANVKSQKAKQIIYKIIAMLHWWTNGFLQDSSVSMIFLNNEHWKKYYKIYNINKQNYKK